MTDYNNDNKGILFAKRQISNDSLRTWEGTLTVGEDTDDNKYGIMLVEKENRGAYNEGRNPMDLYIKVSAMYEKDADAKEGTPFVKSGKKFNEPLPDFSNLQLSGWENVSKKGAKYISLKLSEKYDPDNTSGNDGGGSF